MEAVYQATQAYHQAQLQYLLRGEVLREIIVDLLVYGYVLGGDLRVADYRGL